MNRQQAYKELKLVSSGTLASITGADTYEETDKVLDELLDTVEVVDEKDLAVCETWHQVLFLCIRTYAKLEF